jgi:hypothetical protein
VLKTWLGVSSQDFYILFSACVGNQNRNTREIFRLLRYDVFSRFTGNSYSIRCIRVGQVTLYFIYAYKQLISISLVYLCARSHPPDIAVLWLTQLFYIWVVLCSGWHSEGVFWFSFYLHIDHCLTPHRSQFGTSVLLVISHLTPYNQYSWEIIRK